MLRVFIILIACLMLVGCGSKSVATNSTDIEKDVFSVVDKYLENASACNWSEVYTILSGEALAEAKANTGRVKITEKIVAKNFNLSPVGQEIVEVTADITKSSALGFDRSAYCFRLKKFDGHWLIYKTTLGQYIHGELNPGKLPPDIENTVKTYFELPLNEKRANDHKYLAGKLLQESQKASHLPEKEQENFKTRVASVESMGITSGYVVALAVCDVFKGGKVYKEEIIVDLLNVNGAWKICRLDVSNLLNL